MYGQRPRARDSDPPTSHEAADSIGTPVLRQRQQAVLVCLRNAPTTGLTDHELAEVYARWRASTTVVPEQSPSGLRTRRKELQAMGLVLDTGERRPLPTGRKAIVWAARGGYNPTPQETTTP